MKKYIVRIGKIYPEMFYSYGFKYVSTNSYNQNLGCQPTRQQASNPAPAAQPASQAKPPARQPASQPAKPASSWAARQVLNSWTATGQVWQIQNFDLLANVAHCFCFWRRFPNGVGIKCSVIKPAYNPYIIHISSLYKEYP